MEITIKIYDWGEDNYKVSVTNEETGEPVYQKNDNKSVDEGLKNVVDCLLNREDFRRNAGIPPKPEISNNKHKHIDLTPEEIEKYKEEIYYFHEGFNPNFDEWVAAGIALGYGETKEDFDDYDYELHRGDYDYTRQ